MNTEQQYCRSSSCQFCLRLSTDGRPGRDPPSHPPPTPASLRGRRRIRRREANLLLVLILILPAMPCCIFGKFWQCVLSYSSTGNCWDHLKITMQCWPNIVCTPRGEDDQKAFLQCAFSCEFSNYLQIHTDCICHVIVLYC